MMEWISVEDELPKEAGEYLVTVYPTWVGNPREHIFVGLDSFRGKTSWAKKENQKVIAWMPKPKAYEPQN